MTRTFAAAVALAALLAAAPSSAGTAATGASSTLTVNGHDVPVDHPDKFLEAPPTEQYVISYQILTRDGVRTAGTMTTLPGVAAPYQITTSREYVKEVTISEREFDPLGLVTAIAGPHRDEVKDSVTTGETGVFVVRPAPGDALSVYYAVSDSELLAMRASGPEGAGVELPTVASLSTENTVILRPGQTLEGASVGTGGRSAHVTVRHDDGKGGVEDAATLRATLAGLPDNHTEFRIVVRRVAL